MTAPSATLLHSLPCSKKVFGHFSVPAVEHPAPPIPSGAGKAQRSGGCILPASRPFSKQRPVRTAAFPLRKQAGSRKAAKPAMRCALSRRMTLSRSWPSAGCQEERPFLFPRPRPPPCPAGEPDAPDLSPPIPASGLPGSRAGSAGMKKETVET
ncbi:hypothetical protein OFAG_02184 [Oxalobacter formigenes HOxBLS]|uniref:Uncharacterized protein n=1 Tax=Oxalobacter paraformigenes TaxID=556268 RepID=T5LUU6_9BURK|nr:hypothetical protein OFAG_02184 [Oxalobacter paraformigenes]